MYALFVLAALGLVPHHLVLTDTADVIELNHFYDGEGRKVFDQVIFWQRPAEQDQPRVMAWRLWKSAAQTPWRDWSHKSDAQSRDDWYVTIWLDGETLREVRAASFVETWTQHDPELEDRQFLPPERRRGLAREREMISRKRPPRP